MTTSISATPSQVFWFLAEPATAPIIDPAVLSYEPEGGTMALGVRNVIHMKMLGLRMKIVTETIEWVPVERMAFRSIKPGRPAIGIATHRFEAREDGTLYTWSMDFTSTGIGGSAAAAMSSALFKRNAAAQQNRLRTVIEAALITKAPPN